MGKTRLVIVVLPKDTPQCVPNTQLIQLCRCDGAKTHTCLNPVFRVELLNVPSPQ